jgi:hypothetical protein
MPYLDLRKPEAEVTLSFVQTAMLFVQMVRVRGNMEGDTHPEVEETCAAREAQAMLGHPSNRDFLEIVHFGMITNSPVFPDAVINANHTFGLDLAGVKGRTVRTPPESMMTNHIQIPRALLERHQRVTLAVDVMFINGVPFLVIVSRGFNLVTATGIRRVMDLYLRRGLQVVISTDG